MRLWTGSPLRLGGRTAGHVTPDPSPDPEEDQRKLPSAQLSDQKHRGPA